MTRLGQKLLAFMATGSFSVALRDAHRDFIFLLFIWFFQIEFLCVTLSLLELTVVD